MSDDIVQEAIKSLEDWDTCYSQNEKMRDVALAALKSQSAEIERLRAENEKLRKAQEQLGMFFIKIGDKGYYVCEAIWREFELLRETKAPYRDGFSDGVQHERQRISYENEKLREALKTVCLGVVSERESLDWFIMDGAALRVARDAIRESGE